MNKKYLWLCFRLYATDAMRILTKTTFLSSPYIYYEFVCGTQTTALHAETATKKLFIVCTRARENARTREHNKNTEAQQERSRRAAE